MELKDYQERAMTTCMASSENFSYMFLNLVGEVGELASKVAKAIRKHQVFIGHELNRADKIPAGTSEIDFSPLAVVVGQQAVDELNCEMQKEAGDILWQLAGLCHVMGWNLEEIAQQNLAKLASRKQRGVISGNGDNR